MKNENKRKVGQYTFLAGHHLNPEGELTLKITPDKDNKNYLEAIEVSLDEHEGLYNQDRIALLVKGDFKNGIELAKRQKDKIKTGEDDEKKRKIIISGKGALLTFARTPYLLHPIVIRVTKGRAFDKGQRSLYHISQLDKNGVLVGGVSVLFQGG